MTSKNPVLLSVIVSTRNRAKRLTTLIQCIGSQMNIENINFEIIIVDNNSTDNTKEVVYAFTEGSNLKIKYVVEQKVGLANARNAGILASKGSLLLFLDDDILFPKEFISNALFGVQEYPEFSIFGFRILPDWDEVALKKKNFKPPFWLTLKKPFNLIQSFLPIHDLGKEVLQYPNKRAQNPIGAAFIVKKEMLEKTGPFREDLGAGQSGLCEDTEFFWYSMLCGFKVLYWPYAAVYHPVLSDRIKISYLHKWCFNLGKSLYLIKTSGRIRKELKQNISSENNELNKFLFLLKNNISLLDSKIARVPIFLLIKLVFLILVLPLTIFLFIFKKPFYISVNLTKTIGEIKQAIYKQKTNDILKNISSRDEIYLQEEQKISI